MVNDGERPDCPVHFDAFVYLQMLQNEATPERTESIPSRRLVQHQQVMMRYLPGEDPNEIMLSLNRD